MADAPKPKILIAEDEALISSVLSRKLNASGFDTVQANNGKEALDFLRKEKFDLLLLDLTMPDIDGFEVLAKLKADNCTMPVMVMSNLSQPEDVQKAKDLGASEYIIKASVEPKQLVELVKECIAKHNC